jgi:hypothetical protein
MGWFAMGVGMVVVAVASWMLGARHEAREEAELPTVKMRPNEPLPMGATAELAPRTIDAAAASSPVRVAPALAAAEPKTKPSAHKAQRAASRPTTSPATAENSQSAATPREACGSRVFVAMVRCMKRECETTRYRDHPQCQKLRREEDAVRLQGG